MSKKTEQKEDWENSYMIGQNKEPAHCTLIPFDNIKSALKGFESSIFINKPQKIEEL